MKFCLNKRNFFVTNNFRKYYKIIVKNKIKILHLNIVLIFITKKIKHNLKKINNQLKKNNR